MLQFQKAHREQGSRLPVNPMTPSHSGIQHANTTGGAAFDNIQSGYSNLLQLDTSIHRSASYSSCPTPTPSAASEPNTREAMAEERQKRQEEQDKEDEAIVEWELLLWETDPLHTNITGLNFADLTSFWAVRT